MSLQSSEGEEGCQDDLLLERDSKAPKKGNRLPLLAVNTSPGWGDELTKAKMMTLRTTLAIPLPTKKAWKLTHVPFASSFGRSHW